MKHPTTRTAYRLLLLLALLLPLLAACGSPAAPTQTGQTGETAAAPEQAAPTEAPPAEEPAAAETPAEEPAEEPAAAETPPSDDGAATAGGDKVLRVHVITYPDVVDPQKSSFANEISILSLNYEGLTKLDKDLKAAPAAAESWEFNDSADEITFKLREGLQYSDGSPLTAENFVYAVERTCSPETAGEYQYILFEIIGCEDYATAAVTDTAALEAGRTMLLEEGVTAPDEQTVVLKLTNPAPYYPYVAGLWVMYPAKQELIEQGGEDWWKDPANQIGNGPFQVTEMAEDQLVRLERNDNYWEGATNLDALEYIFQKETAVALEAYRAGQIDVMAPDPSQLPAIKGDPELSEQLLVYAGANTYAWGLNQTVEPWTDKKMREALAYALDRQTYCDVVRNGDCVPALSWIPEGIAGSIETDAYQFDPEKAKQALAESSYGSPEAVPEIKLSYNSDDSAAQPRIEWIAGQLRDILGVNVTLDPVDGQTLVSMRKSFETYPQTCIFCSNWFQDYPDPQNWLSSYWHSSASGASRIGFKSEAFDKLTDQADVELDEAKRTELYEQASQQLIEDLPAPFVYHLANIFLVKPEVTGYTPTSADSQWPGQWGSILSVDVDR